MNTQLLQTRLMLVALAIMTVIGVQNCSTTNAVEDTGTSSLASAHITITSTPSNTQVAVGGSVLLSFTAESEDSKVLTYQWLKDGVYTISGATSSSLYLSSVTEDDEGYYSLEISDGTYWSGLRL